MILPGKRVRKSKQVLNFDEDVDGLESVSEGEGMERVPTKSKGKGKANGTGRAPAKTARAVNGEGKQGTLSNLYRNLRCKLIEKPPRENGKQIARSPVPQLQSLDLLVSHFPITNVRSHLMDRYQNPYRRSIEERTTGQDSRKTGRAMFKDEIYRLG